MVKIEQIPFSLPSTSRPLIKKLGIYYLQKVTQMDFHLIPHQELGSE